MPVTPIANPTRPIKRPPLRVQNQPDASDGDRIAYAQGLWHDQDAALRSRDRQVEENVRMLVGQQWAIYDPISGAVVDPTKWMTENERKWKQRPVVNRILPWFMLTHARLTENPPIVTFVPGPDRIDSLAAQTWDVILKTVWREAEMTDAHDRLVSWLIPGGRAYTLTRIDPNQGRWVEWRAEAAVPVLDAHGEPVPDAQGNVRTMVLPNVPHNAQGEPLAVVTPDGPMELGKPHMVREGRLVVDILSAPEVRGEWGPTPWHRKRWHAYKVYLPPTEVKNRWGVDCKPDVTGPAAENAGELQRLLFGGGWWGAADGTINKQVTTSSGSRDSVGFCEVLVLYEAPLPPEDPHVITTDGQPNPESGLDLMVASPENPGGRRLVVTRQYVLADGPRECEYPYTSPLHAFDFVNLPGRPHGSTPQEALNNLNRLYNRGFGQIIEHTNLVANPIGLIDKQSGLSEVEFTNEPGVSYDVTKRPGVAAVEYVIPPPLSEDVYKRQEIILREMQDLGNMNDTASQPVARDASGELVKELRFDNDRYFGPTARRMVEEYGRQDETWMAIIRKWWTTPRYLDYAGEDNIAQTLMVLPEILQQGQVNVVPDVESMLPEGRGERQARVHMMYREGLFGLPGSPEAIKMYFDLSDFPHLSRAAKPGGIDRTMAEHILGMIVQGASIDQVPYFDWYDPAIHLSVIESYMKSPEFLQQPPPVQQTLAMCRQRYQMALQAKMLQQAQQMATLQGIANPQPQGGAGGGKPTKAGDQEPRKGNPTPPPASARGPSPLALSGTPQES